NGVFSGELNVPATLTAGSFFIEARERGSNNVARARGMIAGGTPQLKLGTQVGKPGDMITVSLHGFSPGEAINVYWNAISGQPVVFLGEQSGTSVAVNWMVEPYMPNAQASTYGGLPGTTVSFYATGFARNEVVHVYVGRTQNSTGSMVSCFSTDQKGNAAAAG